MNTASETNETNAEPLFRKVDRRYIILSRITGLIVAALMSTGLFIGTLIYWFVQEFNWISWTIGAAALTGIVFLFVLAIFWPNLDYNNLRWRLGDIGLEIHRGVLWRHQISVPVARVQHADVAQGPLQRHFGLGTLIVHTAGTQNSSVELDGLNHDLAVRLRDEIVKQKESVDVV